MAEIFLCLRHISIVTDGTTKRGGTRNVADNECAALAGHPVGLQPNLRGRRGEKDQGKLMCITVPY